MPGEFNDLIPLPTRNPNRSVSKSIVADATDAQFGPPQPDPIFGAPESVPEQQSARPTAVDRVINKFARRANREIFAGGRPLGLRPEMVEILRQAGVFNGHTDDSALPNAVNQFLKGPRDLTEAAVRSAVTLGDLGARALTGIVAGGDAAARQTLNELGMSQGMANRLVNDIEGMFVARAPRIATTPRAPLDIRPSFRKGRPPPFRPLPISKEMPLDSSVQEFKDTISRVLDTRRSIVGGVSREDVGFITVDYGRPDPKRKFTRRGKKNKMGFGLIKIIKKRTEDDGIDGEQFVRERLPEILARGKRQDPRGDPRKREERITLVLGEDQVTLSLFRFGKRETWILTGYKTDETKRKKGK